MVKGHTDRWLKNRYLAYNRAYFHGTLPLDLTVLFKAPPQGSWAVTWFEQGQPTAIYVSPVFRDEARFACIVLLHEMSHVAVGDKERQYHGPLFRKERKRLVEAGAWTNLL